MSPPVFALEYVPVHIETFTGPFDTCTGTCARSDSLDTTAPVADGSAPSDLISHTDRITSANQQIKSDVILKFQ